MLLLLLPSEVMTPALPTNNAQLFGRIPRSCAFSLKIAGNHSSKLSVDGRQVARLMRSVRTKRVLVQIRAALRAGPGPGHGCRKGEPVRRLCDGCTQCKTSIGTAHSPHAICSQLLLCCCCPAALFVAICWPIVGHLLLPGNMSPVPVRRSGTHGTDKNMTFTALITYTEQSHNLDQQDE